MMQMKLYLQCQEVYFFVGGSFPSLLSHIVSIYMVAPTINPSFLSWKQHDHLIMSAFFFYHCFFFFLFIEVLLIVNIQ